MAPFDLRVSAFSICWLRAYDFGLEQEALERAIVRLETFPLVEGITHIANADEIDEDEEIRALREQQVVV